MLAPCKNITLPNVKNEKKFIQFIIFYNNFTSL